MTEVTVKKGSDLSPEELSQLGAEASDEGESPEEQVDEDTKDDETQGPPDWFESPPGWKIPVGKQVLFVRFRGAWTENRKGGDRMCALWNLTEADEKLALQRARGDSMRAVDEMAKQMIRAIDGHKADWSGKFTKGNVNTFWTEIGGKCRQQIKNIYLRRHSFDTGEVADFLVNCVAVRTSGG